MTHDGSVDDSVHGLVFGYALDALDDGDLALFETHLDACSACQATLADLAETTASLGSSSHVPPPPNVEARILASVLGSPAELGDPLHVPPPVPTVHVRTWAPARWVAVAAALVLVVGVGATTMIWQRATPSPIAVAAASPTQQVMDIAAEPDAHLMPVSLPGADASFVVSMNMDKAGVVATKLAMPAGGHVYQMWTVMPDHSMHPAGTFVPDAAGHAAAVLQTSVNGATAIMVTIEPASGSVQPTTEPLDEVTL